MIRRTADAASQGSSKDLDQAEDEAPLHASSSVPPKAKRKRITPEQQEILNEVFETTDTPNLELRTQLSQQIGMTPREIQVYYQNQRAKRRRLARNEAAQAALMAASAATSHPTTISYPYAPLHALPAGLVATYPDAASIWQPPAAATATATTAAPSYGRRRSLDDLLAPSSTGHSPTNGPIRLPSLRDVFPDLMPPLPAVTRAPPQSQAHVHSARPGERPVQGLTDALGRTGSEPTEQAESPSAAVREENKATKTATASSTPPSTAELRTEPVA